jgi:hypothetical protein
MTIPSADDPVMPAWPDWRDAEQYRHMLDLDQAGWAWEWLRRNPDYVEERRRGALGALPDQALSYPDVLSQPMYSAALRWGLCFR